MVAKFDDPRRWSKLAAEARAVAATMSDPFSKRELLLIAQHYEGLAQRGARRLEESGSQQKSA